jgi:hypothetical protein
MLVELDFHRLTLLLRGLIGRDQSFKLWAAQLAVRTPVNFEEAFETFVSHGRNYPRPSPNSRSLQEGQKTRTSSPP